LRTSAGKPPSAGVYGFDLAQPQDWPTLRKYGLTPTMGPTGGVSFENGLIHKELHEGLEKSVRATLDQCAAGGCPNMITVGGQRPSRLLKKASPRLLTRGFNPLPNRDR
jgi:hypothetical protein